MTPKEIEKKKKEIERAKKEARLHAVYVRLFGSKDGQTVLTHLSEIFGLEASVFNPVTQGDGHWSYDPLTAAKQDGGRGVLIFIKDKLRKPLTLDGNIEKPKNKVIR